MAISKKAWTGLAKDTSPGTAAAAPVLYLPTKATFENKRKPVYHNEDRGTRDMNYGVVQTTKMAEGTLKGAWFNDSAVYLLLGYFGAPTSTQPAAGTDPTVYQHAFALQDIPEAISFFKSSDAACYSFPYGAVSKLSFSLANSEALLEYDANVIAKWGTKVGSPPTPTFSSLTGFAGSMATVTIGGSANGDIEELKIDLTASLLPWFGIAGQRDIDTIYYGGREVKFELTARFDADTFYNHFFTDDPTIESIKIDAFGPTISTTYKQQFTLNMPLCNYDAAKLDESKENVTVKFTGTAMPGTTANSLCTATIQNTITAYTS